MAFQMNGQNQRKSAMAEINVTPLVDVMLVLLIIFMVTAPMMQEGVSVDLPEAQGKALERNQDVQEMVVALRDNGEIYLNEEKITEDRLVPILKERAAENKRGEVYLRADKNVSYGSVVRVIGSLKNAGIVNLNMITSPQAEKPLAQ